MAKSEFERDRREDDAAFLDAACSLVREYRKLITESGVRNSLDDGGDFEEQFREIDRLETAYDRMVCQCCHYGNHDIRCTCDGDGCCHPEAYLEYDPDWGHGRG